MGSLSRSLMPTLQQSKKRIPMNEHIATVDLSIPFPPLDIMGNLD